MNLKDTMQCLRNGNAKRNLRHRCIMWTYQAIRQVILILCIALISVAPVAAMELCPDSYANWMGDDKYINNKSLKDLVIPGSHDAGMWETRDCKLGSDCNTKTQNLNMEEQLRCGVRYFDIRPVHYNQSFFTGHYGGTDPIVGCNGGSLDEVLEEVNEFANHHTKELIILKLSHYYDRDDDTFGFKKSVMDKLKASVKAKLGSTLFRSSVPYELIKTSVNTLLAHGNVMVLFEGEASEWSEGILNTNDLYTYDRYSNTWYYPQMEADQFWKLAQEGGRNDQLFLLSWTLTQPTEMAVGCAIDRYGAIPSILDLSIEANRNLKKIRPESEKQNKLPNIIYTDNVDGLTTQVAAQLSGIKRNLKPRSCRSNSECSSRACGRLQAGDENLVCCPSGHTSMYTGYDYCTQMPNGSLCWSDSMCASGYCEGNWSGLRKGRCS